MNKDFKPYSRIFFWLVFAALILLGLIPLISNRPRCAEYKTETKKVTYYDFSESGTGVTEGEETSRTCIKWTEKR